MAFVVEDGTGLATATSYASVEFADDYHTDRENFGWQGPVSDKRAALIRATDFVDLTWKARFIGDPLTDGQALAWPRDAAFDLETDAEIPSDAVPVPVLRAVAELALVSLTSSLFADASKPRLRSESEKIGRVEVRRTFSTAETNAPVLAQVKEILRPLLQTAGARPLIRV